MLALEVDEIQLARNLAITDLPNVRFAHGGAQKIPAPDASFDLVLMFKSLHHVPDANGTIRCSGAASSALVGALNYVVNPDGSFLMSESPGMANPEHGQIVDHGHTLLLDGTTKTLPEILSWSGVCRTR